MTETAERVAQRFAEGGAVSGMERLRGGHIHHSWVVTLRRARAESRLLLQRINQRVFTDPERLMQNVERVTTHVRGALSLVPADDGSRHARDQEGGWWRAYRYIESTTSFEAPETPEMAYRAAHAFGTFQRALVDLPGPPLHDTIPAFHDTPRRYAAFLHALERDVAARAASARHEIEQAIDARALAHALIEPFRRGEIAERVVHNDAKMSNVLFDTTTREVVCVVDLDTVMPGLALYDFGDMARSMASPASEDERDLSRAAARPEFFAALAQGFLDGAGPVLAAADRERLLVAARVITYEQALRFLTDHLEGDRYYAVSRHGQNLDRARTQLALLQSFEEQEQALLKAI